MSDTDRLFAALADDVRRRLLFRLCEEDTIQIPEGATRREPSCSASVAGKGTQGAGRRLPETRSSQSVTDGGRASTSLEIELYHTHLPKLREDGFITWERGTGRVSRGPRFERIEPALRVVRSNAGAFPDGV